MDAEFFGMFTEATERLRQWYVELYAGALELIGFRLRASLAIEQKAVAIFAFGEGALLRRSTSPEVFVPMALRRELDGATVEWDLFGFGVRAIVEAFIEEDPAWGPQSG